MTESKGSYFSGLLPTELSLEAQNIFRTFVASHDAEKIEAHLDETLLDINDYPQWHQGSYFRLYELKKIMRQMQKVQHVPHKPLCLTIQIEIIQYINGHHLWELVDAFDERLRNIHQHYGDCHHDSYAIIFDLKKMVEKWQRIDLYPASYLHENLQHKLLKATDFCATNLFEKHEEQPVLA